ncbi:choice-of-anchor Q domain-containing protein [Ekhidna sp.]
MNRSIIPLLFYLIVAFSTTAQNTYYVDVNATTGLKDGSSWTNAFTDLQPALDEAQPGDEVWVAQGTYLPTESPNQTSTDTRDKSFHLDKDIRLYGGFTGTETQLDQRDFQSNLTILSGDFNDDDATYGMGESLQISDNGENAYHVMITAKLSSHAIIDGFTIKSGHAHGTGGSITFSGILFMRSMGGGMINRDSSPSMTNIIFEENKGLHGGGLLNRSSSPSISNVTFTRNYASNAAGMLNHQSSFPIISSTSFIGNRAQHNGGGMSNNSNCAPQIYNSTFVGNFSYYGAAMYNVNAVYPTIVNSTFTMNTAGFHGSSIYNNTLLSPVFKNCIIWENSSYSSTASIYNINGSDPSFSYSIIEGSGGSNNWDSSLGQDLGNNLDERPYFIDSSEPNGPDGIPRTSDDGLTLLKTSPAINSGTNSGVNAEDILGNPRVYGSSADMGAYEFQGRIWYVKPNAVGSNNGTSWENAFTDLQPALDTATIGDRIWVAEGVYMPTESPDMSSIDDRDKSFHLDKDLLIYGGFAGNEVKLDERDVHNNPTILSGDIAQNDLVSGSGSTLSITDNEENTYHVLINFNLTYETVIDGFTISGGNADANGSIVYSSQFFYKMFGGGIYNWNSSPTFSNIIITANSADSGGGIYNELAYNTVAPDSDMINLFISKNEAEIGGGMYNSSSHPSLVNAVFVGNRASLAGGGIYNTLVSNPSLINDVLTDNMSIYGGGMVSENGSLPTVTNTIIWGNVASTSGPELHGSGMSIFTNSLIQGSGGSSMWDSSFGTDNGGNLDADPLFFDASNPIGTDNIFGTVDDGLTLTNPSPAIDTGDNNASQIDTDIAGNPRPYGTNVDLGAYEFQGGLVPPSPFSARAATKQIADTLSTPEEETRILTIYPNPASDRISIAGLQKEHTAIIYSFSGSKILTTKGESKNIDISSLKKGTYILMVNDRSGKMVYQTKLVKKH